MSHEGGAAPVSLGLADSSGSSALLRFIQQGRSFSGREPHCFFLNTHKNTFADLSAASSLNLIDDGRGVGLVDWDLDGDLDLWIINRNGPQLRFLQNHLPKHHRFVSLKLVGSNCNRDAIGARVVINAADELPQAQTLRAGDGYLSQSSKWLHFGLGKSDQPVKAKVKWPDGTEQTFENLETNQRHVLTQNQSSEAIATKSLDLSRLQPTSLEAKSQDSIRMVSISGVPVPKFRFEYFTGKQQIVFNVPSPKTTLLCLFASWCPSCETLFADLTRKKDQVAASNLNVVAASVDRLDASTSKPVDVQAKLDSISFPYAAGWANAAMVEKFQLLNDYLFDLHLPIPVPTCLLIGPDGTLIAMYKGAVSAETILKDAKLAGQPLDQRRADSVPFTGKWHEPINRTSHVVLLDSLTAAGFLGEADDYVRRLPTARKQSLLPAIVRMAMAMYRKGHQQKAAEHFRVVVKMDPTFVGVETELAKERIKEGRPDSTVKLYREALRRNPTNLTSLNNLAWILATHPKDELRNGNEAIQFAAKAVQISNRKRPEFLDTLAASHAESGDFEKAIEVGLQAAAMAKQQGKISGAQSIEMRIEQYRKGRPIRSSE